MKRFRRWLAYQCVDVAIDLWPHKVEESRYRLSENGLDYYSITFTVGGQRCFIGGRP